MTDYNEDNMGESILDIDTSDAQEPASVDAGEYKIRITGFRKDGEGNIVRVSEKGNKYFIVTFDIPSEEFSKGLSKVFSVPDDNMEPKRINAIKYDLACFKKAFNLDELNFSRMIGCEGYALLKVVGTEDSQYGIQNEIAKFIVGA